MLQNYRITEYYFIFISFIFSISEIYRNAYLKKIQIHYFCTSDTYIYICYYLISSMARGEKVRM